MFSASAPDEQYFYILRIQFNEVEYLKKLLWETKSEWKKWSCENQKRVHDSLCKSSLAK